MTCLAEAAMTSFGPGGEISSTVSTLTSRSIRRNEPASRAVNIAMAVPDLPARPVRPDRWRKDSASGGRS